MTHSTTPPPTAPAPLALGAERHRMPAGLGCIGWQHRIICYCVERDEIVWARPLGDPPLTVTDELATAIWSDYRQQGGAACAG